MKKLLFSLLAFPCLVAGAQQKIDVNSDVNIAAFFHSVGGEPVATAKFTRLVEGTPYYMNEWIKGTVITPGGKEYKDIPVKLDLYHNEVHYKDNNDKEFIASTPIREVVIGSNRFVHSSSFTGTSNVKEGWYQLLHSGTANLYKYYKKELSENKPFNSAIYEQTIKTTPIYYVQYNNALLEIKKLKDAPSILATHKDALEKFLEKSDKKSSTMDERFSKLVEHYNSLLGSNKN
ncbi:MAG TPA: hypothetical protein VGB46_13170 [Flavisolibacter sp.]|jgi:hypothetical protein